MKYTITDKAYNRVRQELCDIGLLADGVYLDQIELYSIGQWVSSTPFLRNTDGFVYDRGVGYFIGLLGFDEGVIYIPAHVSKKGQKYLEDVIRHEYAHAWAWLDPDFIDEAWFEDTFGSSYDSASWPAGEQLLKAFENKDNVEEFYRRGHDIDYASAYAMTSPKEDFAETFYHYLKAPHNINDYCHRKGFYRKLKAIYKAVKRKAKQLG